MNIVVNGLLTNYQQLGDGKTVLLLHGWGDTSQTFVGLQKELAKTYQAIALDLPGFGQTQPPELVWGLNDYADFVGAFLTKLQQKPYAIVAHSNGGAIAIRGLAVGNLQAEKLILLASAGIRSEYKGRKLLLRLAAKGAKALTAPLPKSAQQKLKKGAYKTIGSDLFVAEHLQETFKKVVTDDVQADASRLNIPTLLLYGQNDTATPPRYGELFHKAIQGSRLEVLPAAGHFLHHDQPDEVNKAVQEFLHG